MTDHAAFSPLRLLGKNSYEVYLSHLFVILPAMLLWKRFGVGWAIPLLYLAVISLVGAARRAARQDLFQAARHQAAPHARSGALVT